MNFIKKIVVFLLLVFVSVVLVINNIVKAKEYDIPSNCASDRIIITLDNETGRKLKDYKPSDFPELSIERIEDLTISSKNKFLD